MKVRIIHDYEGLAVEFRTDDLSNDPEDELIREFMRQHENSHLIVAKAGGYYSNIGRGVSTSTFVIRKKLTQPSWLKRWFSAYAKTFTRLTGCE